MGFIVIGEGVAEVLIRSCQALYWPRMSVFNYLEIDMSMGRTTLAKSPTSLCTGRKQYPELAAKVLGASLAKSFGAFQAIHISPTNNLQTYQAENKTGRKTIEQLWASL